MTYIRRGRYVHDTKQWERDGLTSGYAQAQVRAHAETALSIFQGTVPRDDNTWADSVTVDGGVKSTVSSDGPGRRAWASIVSSDPTSYYKELGHVVVATRKKGERTNRKGRIGPLERGKTNRFIRGAHTMTKAMRAATGSGGRVGRG